MNMKRLILIGIINENNKQPVKRKELKELDYYINLLKKPIGN